MEIVVTNVGTGHWVGSGEDKEERDRNDEWWDDMMTNLRSTHLPTHKYIWSFGQHEMGFFYIDYGGKEESWWSGGLGMGYGEGNGSDAGGIFCLVSTLV